MRGGHGRRQRRHLSAGGGRRQLRVGQQRRGGNGRVRRHADDHDDEQHEQHRDPEQHDQRRAISGSAGTSTTKFVGESFTTGASGFTLDKLEFLITGPTSNGSTINVFAVTAGGTGTSQTVTPAATGLLGVGGAGLTIASGTPTGGTNLETLDFTGTDEIALAANTTYYAEIGGGTAGDFFVVRGQDVYSGGNAYLSTTGVGNRGTIFGGGVRDAAFAFYATAAPEPASLATLAVVAGAIRRRRQR